MRTVRFAAAASLALGLCAALASAQQLDPKFIAGCQKCHGQGGDSVSPIFPRLNAQQPEYLSAQLKNFRDHKRDDTHARGYMWGNARVLDDKTVAQIAQYFAQQKPTAPQTGGALAGEGAQLYQNGDPTKAINACQQCHGKAGEGMGVMPRIAGQHSAYFRTVMGAFRSGQRKSDVMGVVAKNLSDRQIEALSSYLTND